MTLEALVILRLASGNSQGLGLKGQPGSDTAQSLWWRPNTPRRCLAGSVVREVSVSLGGVFVDAAIWKLA